MALALARAKQVVQRVGETIEVQPCLATSLLHGRVHHTTAAALVPRTHGTPAGTRSSDRRGSLTASSTTPLPDRDRHRLSSGEVDASAAVQQLPEASLVPLPRSESQSPSTALSSPGKSREVQTGDRGFLQANASTVIALPCTVIAQPPASVAVCDVASISSTPAPSEMPTAPAGAIFVHSAPVSTALNTLASRNGGIVRPHVSATPATAFGAHVVASVASAASAAATVATGPLLVATAPSTAVAAVTTATSIPGIASAVAKGMTVSPRSTGDVTPTFCFPSELWMPVSTDCDAEPSLPGRGQSPSRHLTSAGECFGDDGVTTVAVDVFAVPVFQPLRQGSGLPLSPTLVSMTKATPVTTTVTSTPPEQTATAFPCRSGRQSSDELSELVSSEDLEDDDSGGDAVGTSVSFRMSPDTRDVLRDTVAMAWQQRSGERAKGSVMTTAVVDVALGWSPVEAVGGML